MGAADVHYQPDEINLCQRKRRAGLVGGAVVRAGFSKSIDHLRGSRSRFGVILAASDEVSFYGKFSGVGWLARHGIESTPASAKLEGNKLSSGPGIGFQKSKLTMRLAPGHLAMFSCLEGETVLRLLPEASMSNPTGLGEKLSGTLAYP